MTPLGARRLGLHRRDLLAATVSVLAFLSSAQAATLKGIPDGVRTADLHRSR